MVLDPSPPPLWQDRFSSVLSHTHTKKYAFISLARTYSLQYKWQIRVSSISFKKTHVHTSCKSSVIAIYKAGSVFKFSFTHTKKHTHSYLLLELTHTIQMADSVFQVFSKKKNTRTYLLQELGVCNIHGRIGFQVFFNIHKKTYAFIPLAWTHSLQYEWQIRFSNTFPKKTKTHVYTSCKSSVIAIYMAGSVFKCFFSRIHMHDSKIRPVVV